MNARYQLKKLIRGKSQNRKLDFRNDYNLFTHWQSHLRKPSERSNALLARERYAMPATHRLLWVGPKCCKQLEADGRKWERGCASVFITAAVRAREIAWKLRVYAVLGYFTWCKRKGADLCQLRPWKIWCRFLFSFLGDFWIGTVHSEATIYWDEEKN